jgi:hypothetical protein
MPELPLFLRRSNTRADHGTEDLRAGFSVEVWARFGVLDARQTLLDNRTERGKGFCLQTSEHGTVEIILNDGRSESHWGCDRGLLAPDQRQHIVAIVDGGPKIIAFVVNGQLCDGGEFRQFGWGRYNPHFQEANGSKTLRIGPDFHGEVHTVRIYNRALRISEAIGNYRA